MPANNDLMENNTSVFVYEDQDGLMMFPNDSNGSKSKGIVHYFENRIVFLLKKKDQDIQIICHIMGSKGRERGTGLYIKYQGHYSKQLFNDFKTEGESALKKIGFNLLEDDSSTNIYRNNTLFKNISSFDFERTKLRLEKSEIRVIKEASKNKENLIYLGGDISTISSFIETLLVNISEFSLCISPIKCQICDINIQSSLDMGELKLIEPTSVIENIKNQNVESLKKEAKNKFIDSIDILQEYGWKDYELINCLLDNCTNSNPKIYNFVRILVQGEYASNNVSYKNRFTESFIELFSDQEYNSLLDWNALEIKFFKQHFQSVKPESVEPKFISQYNHSQDSKDPIIDIVLEKIDIKIIIVLILLLVSIILLLGFEYDLWGNSTSLSFLKI